MKKRITSSVLLLLVLAQLASSGGGSGGKDTSAANGEESTVPEETRVWRDSLPELDFEGKTFTIAIYENPDARNQVLSDEQTGDTINDAIYEATLNVSQRFNVKLEQLIDESDAPGSTADTKSFFRNNVLAGDAPFHVSNTRAPNALSFYAEELIIPFDELEYIDLSQPYWADEANAANTIYQFRFQSQRDI